MNFLIKAGTYSLRLGGRLPFQLTERGGQVTKDELSSVLSPPATADTPDKKRVKRSR